MKRSRLTGAVPSAHPAALSVGGRILMGFRLTVLFLREASCESWRKKGGFLMEKTKHSWSVRKLVFLALMVAMNVVLSRLSIQLSSEIRLSIVGFLPMAMAGMLLGPLSGGLTGALGDIVNYVLFTHVYGAYFPGYTLTALLSGLWYGWMLHNHKLTWPRAILTILPVIVLGEMGLNSVWVYMMYSKTFWAKLPLRLLTNLVELPLKVLLLVGMERLTARIPKSYLKL